MSKPGTEGDILQPISSEKARATYLEEHMKNMGGVQLLLNIPSKMEESHASVDLARRIDIFCKEQKEKKKAGMGISSTDFEYTEGKEKSAM